MHLSGQATEQLDDGGDLSVAWIILRRHRQRQAAAERDTGQPDTAAIHVRPRASLDHDLSHALHPDVELLFQRSLVSLFLQAPEIVVATEAFLDVLQP